MNYGYFNYYFDLFLNVLVFLYYFLYKSITNLILAIFLKDITNI